MIEVERVERMAESLRLYDVVDGGWEGDPNGAEPKTIKENLAHVGDHLADVIAFKDFFDPEIVEGKIAPDVMQYGLRVARWGRLALDEVIEASSPNDPETVMLQGRLHLRTIVNRPIGNMLLANGILLGKQMHDEGHKDKRPKAQASRREPLTHVSGLLIQTAYLQARNHRFDLERAFDSRLESLRERFNVPRLDKS